MNLEVQKPTDLELYSNKLKKGIRIKKKRFIIGTSQTCDLVINSPKINPIHAVLEISGTSALKVYDMNSKFGTKINGESVVAKELNLSDVITFGDIDFELRKYNKVDIPKAPLAVLDDLPLPGKIEDLPPITAVPNEPVEVEKTSSPSLPSKPIVVKKEMSGKEEVSVVYPLGKDPKAEFSEYIFEDVETLYPIFHYDIAHAAVEVVTLFQGEILSVDYLPQKDGLYHLKGWDAKDSDIEYPYLGKNEKIPFVDIKGGETFVSPVPGFEMMTLTDSGKNEKVSGSVILNQDDIFRFSKGDLQIFVRGTDAPPRVDAAPVFRRDNSLKKILLAVFLFLLTFLFAMQLFEVDKELEKEKAPERLASILYKPKKLVISKNKAIDKTKTAPKVNQKSPTQTRKKPTPKVKKEVAKTQKATKQPKGDIAAKKVAPVKKANPRKGPTKTKTTRVTRTNNKRGGSRNSKSTARSNKVNAKTQGSVDTYKSIDFKSSLSSLMAKGGSTKSIQPVVNNRGSGGSTSSSFEGGESMQVETAEVSTEVGDFKGVSSGRVDRSKGVDGIVNKKNIATAGLPYRTVVLGSMDPDIIRRLIMAHASQFRSCYQSVLEKSPRAFNGIVKLDFTIGASGHVSRVAAQSQDSRMPLSVRSCVANVLRGIKFPEPMGGGSVSVKQPINFYPKSI